LIAVCRAKHLLHDSVLPQVIASFHQMLPSDAIGTNRLHNFGKVHTTARLKVGLEISILDHTCRRQYHVMMGADAGSASIPASQHNLF